MAPSAGLDVGEQEEELVAALPGDRVGLADGRAEPLGDGAQQLVARRVAEVVVDELEVVEVDEEDRDVRAGAPRPREGEVEVLGEHRAVRQAGERVVEGEVRELGLELLARVMSKIAPSSSVSSPRSSVAPRPCSWTQRIVPSACRTR